ncbi:hypothetical protein AAF712_014698 [Marasmius tenuissimus]|uniref:Uncharacterized protein n=1 Tax=Marasmius tenuissimus TaxID=585030 RepID=A0ABR2ZBM5_9AGAR
MAGKPKGKGRAEGPSDNIQSNADNQDILENGSLAEVLNEIDKADDEERRVKLISRAEMLIEQGDSSLGTAPERKVVVISDGSSDSDASGSDDESYVAITFTQTSSEPEEEEEQADNGAGEEQHTDSQEDRHPVPESSSLLSDPPPAYELSTPEPGTRSSQDTGITPTLNTPSGSNNKGYVVYRGIRPGCYRKL